MNQKVSTPWLVNTMTAISSVPSVPVMLTWIVLFFLSLFLSLSQASGTSWPSQQQTVTPDARVLACNALRTASTAKTWRRCLKVSDERVSPKRATYGQTSLVSQRRDTAMARPAYPKLVSIVLQAKMGQYVACAHALSWRHKVHRWADWTQQPHPIPSVRFPINWELVLTHLITNWS